jgi:gentisate 1,2-dioxygenase
MDVKLSASWKTDDIIWLPKKTWHRHGKDWTLNF